MHPVMRSDFLNGLLFLDGLQRDSCFHFRAEAPPLPRFHFYSLSEAAILHLNEWSEFWGALHRPSSANANLFPQRRSQPSQDRRRFLREARASPLPIFGLITNSSTVTPERST